MDHHTAPCMDQWAIRGTTHSVTDCQYCTKFPICHLNANDSRPAFRSSIIMCNQQGVSSESFVMQAKCQLLL